MPGTGCLRVIDSENPESAPQYCPLKHTHVESNIAGFIGRTTVRQTYENTTQRKVEAIYAFPLANEAAVDRMTLLVGDRRIVGQVKVREEARAIYERARAAGHVASLLDQERPNIFTQSIANIEPGAKVEIEISYVETLSYQDGMFEWTFPMVVGPRYIPGGGSAPRPNRRGHDTPKVPDASRITPPVTPLGTRAGHDISLRVTIDGGSLDMAPTQIASALHAIEQSTGPRSGSVEVSLKNEKEIPNRDFVLRYRLGGGPLGNAWLTHADERGSFFSLILQPPQRVVPDAVVPREVVFVLDTSGSMQGFPIEKAKEVIARTLDGMRPSDSFNLITFSGDTNVLWDAPRPATTDNVQLAQQFLATRQGGGGTEMMKAIDAALVQTRGVRPRIETACYMGPDALMHVEPDGRQVSILLNTAEIQAWPPPDVRSSWNGLGVQTRLGVFEITGVPAGPDGLGRTQFEATGTWARSRSGDHALFAVNQFRWVDQTVIGGGAPAPIRIVCFMTDGYVGNDMEIIDAVKKNADTTRVFAFGIGNSVNRFLLDQMAVQGRGEVEYVLLNANAEASVARFHERISAPVLTDIQIDWGDLPVSDVYPQRVPDLFSAKPIVVHGRLSPSIAAGHGPIRLTGNTGRGRFEQTIAVGGAGVQAQPHDALASLWARAKVDDLMQRDYAAAQSGNFPADLKQQVTDLGLRFSLMTQFTSFVAVEELVVTRGGQPATVHVPVEMPQGVSYEGVFGNERRFSSLSAKQRAPTGGVTAPVPLPSSSMREAGRHLFQQGAAGDVEQSDVAAALDSLRRDPSGKLQDLLQSLAERVQKEGRDGDWSGEGVTVSRWRIEVVIELSVLSDAVRAALSKLGFELSGELKATQAVLGTIDVRKLEELAKIEAVIRVRTLK